MAILSQQVVGLRGLLHEARDPRAYDHALRVGLLVFAGYYLGAQLGLALTFSPLPLSVLWPPNAILFAALILVPVNLWWVVVVAALPAHVLTQLGGGIPAGMVLCWYVSNVFEALLGAAALRIMIGRAHPFETPRNVLLFLLACADATVMSSFLDAAFVKLNGWGAGAYWDLWVTRVFSNLTADVVVVPPVVTLALLARPWLRGVEPRRAAEAAVLATGVVLVAVIVFNTPRPLGVTPAEICVPLPLLLWAAMRFGPAGTSLAFTTTIVGAIWGAAHGLGALGDETARENAHAVQLFALSLGPTLLFLATAIRERKLSDEMARLEHKRFQLMMEAMKDTVYERDLSSGAMSWSARALTRFGYVRRDSGEHFGDFIALVHQDDHAQVVDRQEEALREGRELWDAEFRMRRADGTYAHVHETGFVVRDLSGTATQMIGALDDVTGRHDADELNHRLAQASRLTAMGELAASIAHEINQPVAAVLGNVDAARMMLDSQRLDRGELRAILDDIRRDNLRTGDIVRHIRGLANKRGTEKSSFDLNELLESVLALVMPAARRRGVAIYGAYGHVPHVTADPIHVQQVLLNLIFNAMDAMRDVPAKDRVMLVMSSRGEDHMVHVAVRDRGHGIPVGSSDRIFDSFYTTKSDGMGLGLSIARSLVTAHGGNIWAKNNSDQGATFTFTIPATRAP